MTPERPPSLAVRLLQWRLPRDLFDPIAGDLEEGFFERVTSHGRLRAQWWYWREALGFAIARRAVTDPARQSRGSATQRIRAGALSTVRDLRFGLRILRRYPSFAFTAIVIMALGVGATTAVFSVLRGVLIEPLPYRDPAQLVVFRATLPNVPNTPALTSAEFAALRARTDLFESVAAAVESDGNLTAPDIMAPMNAAAVSEDFLATLGVAPALGRSVRRGDTGARWSINISHEVWQRYFHGRPDILGSPIQVNANSMTVAGVLPRGFKAYLGSGAVLPSHIDLLYFRGGGYDDDPFRGNVVIARLRDGVTIETVRAAVDTVARNVVAQYQERYRTGPLQLSVASLEEEVTSDARPALLAAAGAVFLVLIVACANLTNLLLARATARTREIAVRLSIGAGRRDIVRQLFAEGLVLGGTGAAAGLLVARWGVNALLALAPAALPRREAIVMDAGAAIFAVMTAFVCALAMSVLPAWQATRPELAASAKGAHAGDTARGALVAAQIALSVVLLVGAGLMTRAFINMRSIPLGFEPGGAASMYVSLSGRTWGTGTIEEARARRRTFYQQLIDRARELPGVRGAGAGFPAPMTGPVMLQRVSLAAAAAERETDGFIAFAGYLEALNVPLRSGRYFTRADDRQRVVIVDERLAQTLWPGESAIGRHLLIAHAVGTPIPAEVVGVVAHIQARGPRDAGLPQVWMTYAVRSYAQLNFVVRAADPLDAAAATGRIAQELRSGRPVRDIRLLDDYVADASADTRFALFVLGGLATLGVILAAVGVYGVVSYAMARRTREIAVRLALGESPPRLVARVLGDGAIWTLAGLLAGLAAAAILARYLQSLLFRIDPHDVLTFAAVAAFLAAVSLAASVFPALRAGRVDPMLALRSE